MIIDGGDNIAAETLSIASIEILKNIIRNYKFVFTDTTVRNMIFKILVTAICDRIQVKYGKIFLFQNA